MPYTPLGQFPTDRGVQRFSAFKRPVTFYDRVIFVGADSRLEIFGGALQGDFFSSDWDGGFDLSGGSDGTATAGWLLDWDSGAAQFQSIYAEGGELGDLNIVGDLILTGSFSNIRTALSAPYMSINSSPGNNAITFATGHADEQIGGFLTTNTVTGVALNLSSPMLDTGTAWGMGGSLVTGTDTTTTPDSGYARLYGVSEGVGDADVVAAAIAYDDGDAAVEIQATAFGNGDADINIRPSIYGTGRTLVRVYGNLRMDANSDAILWNSSTITYDGDTVPNYGLTFYNDSTNGGLSAWLSAFYGVMVSNGSSLNTRFGRSTTDMHRPLVLTNVTNADLEEVLRLDIARSWSFYQGSTSASAKLVLAQGGGLFNNPKTFEIGGDNGSDVYETKFAFNTVDGTLTARHRPSNGANATGLKEIFPYGNINTSYYVSSNTTQPGTTEGNIINQSTGVEANIPMIAMAWGILSATAVDENEEFYGRIRIDGTDGGLTHTGSASVTTTNTTGNHDHGTVGLDGSHSHSVNVDDTWANIVCFSRRAWTPTASTVTVSLRGRRYGSPANFQNSLLVLTMLG